LGISTAKDKFEIKTIDGVRHIMNPKEPMKGIVQLELEKILEIDPYLYEDVKLKGFDFARDSNGNVILFNPNIVEAQRFNNKGEYLGSLVRKGQGPGEFPDFSFFKVHFMNDQIWATGNLKLAKYDKNAHFLSESKIGYRPQIIIDENTFFVINSQQDKHGLFVKILLINLSSAKTNKASTISFFQASNVGMIKMKGGGFDAPYVTPRIDFSYDHKNKKLFAALNTEYKIYVKNLKGEILFIIERPYKKVRLSSKDKKKLLAAVFRPGPVEPSALSACPDKLVAIKDIKILPKGYIAVYRITSPEVFEVDVFDPDGRYIYIMEPPPGTSLENVKFHSRGFATIVEKEDKLVYVDYKIKNLPEIFADQ
jgi:hypothetical protein